MNLTDTTVVKMEITGKWDDAKMEIVVKSNSSLELKALLKSICALIGQATP